MPASPALYAKSSVIERVAVVIPTLNEAESIGAVIAALPRHLVDHIIVADGGSTDGTPQIAHGAGAEVIAAGAGYGRACRAGAEAAGDADVLVFMDGDGADDPSAIEDMVAALRPGGYDFVIGSRTRGKREDSSMAGHQILAGIVIGGLIRVLYGVHYTDMAAFRAIRRATLLQLGMREMTYGWNLEMQGAFRLRLPSSAKYHVRWPDRSGASSALFRRDRPRVARRRHELSLPAGIRI